MNVHKSENCTYWKQDLFNATKTVLPYKSLVKSSKVVPISLLHLSVQHEKLRLIDQTAPLDCVAPTFT